MTPNDIPKPCFMAMQLTKFKSEISKLVKYQRNLIGKGYDLTTIVYSLRQVCFSKNIDNLLLQPVGPTSN